MMVKFALSRVFCVDHGNEEGSKLIACRHLVMCLLLVLMAAATLSAHGQQVELNVWTRLPRETAEVFFKTFEELNPDIKINAEYIPGGKNHINKLVAAVAAGQAPDVSTLDVIATEQFAHFGAL